MSVPFFGWSCAAVVVVWGWWVRGAAVLALCFGGGVVVLCARVSCPSLSVVAAALLGAPACWGVSSSLESLILAQDERWRRA